MKQLLRERGVAIAEDAEDARIVYGVGCTWWGSIYEVAKRERSGLPCCPECGGMLMEVESQEVWDENVQSYADSVGDSGYPAYIAWLRGRCIQGHYELGIDSTKVDWEAVHDLRYRAPRHVTFPKSVTERWTEGEWVYVDRDGTLRFDEAHVTALGYVNADTAAIYRRAVGHNSELYWQRRWAHGVAYSC